MEPFLIELFVDVVNMSITASYVILFVLLGRLFLKKAPKVFSYGLWSVVLFRLVCPFSFASSFSFLKVVSPSFGKMQYIPSDIGMMAQPKIDTGINSVNSIINNSLPPATTYGSVNPMQITSFIFTVIWVAGVISLLLYSIISYLELKNRISIAMLVKDNIFECESIASPFVMGIIKPKIYLPTGVKGPEQSYILKHEQTHIKRFDYLIKPLAFLALCVHWFNPLAWLGFILMTKDMEMSCDESVLRELGLNIKKDYSTSLLSLAVSRKMINGSPLAFGESNVKARIKNVLNYKKPGFWVVIVAVVAVCATVIGFSVNPKESFDLEKTRVESMLFSTEETDLLKIGEVAFDHYYSSFMGENIPDEYRITDFKLNEISLLAGDEKEFCVTVKYDHTTTGLYFLSANGGGEQLADGGYVWQGSTGEFRIKRLGGNGYETISIGTGGGAQGLAEPEIQPLVGSDNGYQEIKRELSLIPKEYSIQDATKDGCFVVVHGKVESEKEIANKFIEDTQNGKKASLKIVQYTTEGDPLITKVVYDGTVYYGVEDDSRDAFKGDGSDYHEFQYQYLKTFEDAGTQCVYLLKDNSLTFEKIQKSLLSSNSNDKIDFYWIYTVSK